MTTPHPPSSTPLDLLIIGAGIFGVCAANTYLTLHPSANILALDADSGPGGVWSRSRLYPGFNAQTGARLSGFPDVPFKVPDGEPMFHDLFEARHLSRYFEEYLAKKVGDDGRALGERFRFEVWVERAWNEGGMWKVTGKAKGVEGGEEPLDLCAKKLIVATGVYTVPFVPELPGREQFAGPILHQKDFGKSKILTPDEPNIEKHSKITVLGGSKSAADIAYAAATDANHFREVTWIIRTSSTGPLMMTHPKGFGKYQSLPEVGSTRGAAAISSANPYVDDSWWSWFIHRTPVGEWLLDKLWSAAAGDATKLASFEGREGRLEGFEGLRSSTITRWRSGLQGIISKDDWWDIIARRVKVVRGEIERLDKGEIVLEDGRTVECDMLLAATGWQRGHTIFSSGEKARLGLPLDLDGEDELATKESEYWRAMEQAADEKVLKRWPYLANPPDFKRQPRTSTPYRLYNMIIPVQDQSVAFLGAPLLPNSYHASLATTLWAIAVLDGIHQVPPELNMEEDVAFIARWCAWRYPMDGWQGNRVEFEMVSYTDKLLAELGLSSHRNKGSWWADLTDPCLASDYAGLVDEYREKYAVKGRS